MFPVKKINTLWCDHKKEFSKLTQVYLHEKKLKTLLEEKK